MICPLRPHNALAIYDEFVSLRLAPENWMIVENQAAEFGPAVFLNKQRCRKAAHSSTHHNAIENFAGIDHICGQ